MDPVLRTHALTRRFGAVTALDSLTVEVAPGITGLVGANGAGKSTLLKILLGLLAPSSGSVELLGMDVADRAPEIRARVGYMPEHDCMPLDMSATDFVLHMARMSGLPAAAARERAADTLRHVGLHDERYRLIGEYSTGMRQRVKLAQALVHDPSLVLLDEPTNGLDPAGRDEMLDLVRRIGTEFGISVIVTSHLLSELERTCESVVVIEGGRLVHHRSTADVTSRSGRVLVELDGDDSSLVAALDAAGIAVQRAGGHLLAVDPGSDAALDLIRDTVAAADDLGLVRLVPERHRMVELFTDD